MSNLSEIWKTRGKNLISPSIFVAYDKNRRKYFVIQDDSTIIFMVMSMSNITFCIPKKYCLVEKKSEANKYYKITNSDKLIPVSCRTKNEYEQFVQENLIN